MPRSFAPVLRIFLRKFSRKKLGYFLRRNRPKFHVVKIFSQKWSLCVPIQLASFFFFVINLRINQHLFNENFDEKFRYCHIFLQAIFSKMQNEHFRFKKEANCYFISNFRRRQYTQLGFIFKSPKDDRSFFYEPVPQNKRHMLFQ